MPSKPKSKKASVRPAAKAKNNGLRKMVKLWEEKHRDELTNLRKPLVLNSSGFELKSVHTPADLEVLGRDYSKDVGLPGEYPYTRGRDAAGYGKRFWGFEFYAEFDSAEEARRRYQFLLEQGAMGGVRVFPGRHGEALRGPGHHPGRSCLHHGQRHRSRLPGLDDCHMREAPYPYHQVHPADPERSPQRIRGPGDPDLSRPAGRQVGGGCDLLLCPPFPQLAAHQRIRLPHEAAGGKLPVGGRLYS